MTKVGPKGPSQGAPWTEREQLSAKNATDRTGTVLSEVNRNIGNYVAAGVPLTRRVVTRLGKDPLQGVTRRLHEDSRGLGRLGIVPRAKGHRS